MPIKFDIPPLGWRARTADFLMTPIMYLAAGTFRESPQRTHRWNNKKLTRDEAKQLDPLQMAFCLGVSGAIPKNGLRFHIPILGGSRDYVVLNPKTSEEWYVGWKSDHSNGISRIRLRGPVRMLLGMGCVSFFAVSAEFPFQVPLEKMGQGRIGENGQYSHIPLL